MCSVSLSLIQSKFLLVQELAKFLHPMRQVMRHGQHLLEPVAALRDMARMLKRRGRLVLHVPWEVESRYARFDPDEPNHHLYHWNAQNLGNLMTVLGWRIEALRVRRYGCDRFAANIAARLRCGNAGFRLIRAGMVALRPLREVELVASRPDELG